MATRIWRGDALALAQVNLLTIAGTPAVSQVYSVTINGKVVSYTASSLDTNITITAALLLLLNASTIPEFAEVTWAAGTTTTTITGTAITAGKPFTQTSASTGTGTLVTTSTAGTGPNDVSLAANWSGAALPAAGDTVVFDSNTVDALYNLSALAAIAPANVTLNASYTGKIGLPAWNGSYYEYRPLYLQFLGCTSLVSIGYGAGTGSGRLKLDFLGNSTTVNVATTAPAIDAALGVNQALQLKGTNAANVLSVNKGSVGIATAPGEVATFATINVGYVSQVLGDAVVYCGSGVTLTTVNQAGGTLTTQSAITTLVQTAGVLTTLSGAITTATIEGTWHAQTSGTYATTVNVLGGATLDLSQDMRARTATTVNLYKGATLNDPFGTSFAGGPMAFKCVECTLEDVTVTAGINHTYTPS